MMYCVAILETQESTPEPIVLLVEQVWIVMGARLSSRDYCFLLGVRHMKLLLVLVRTVVS